LANGQGARQACGFARGSSLLSQDRRMEFVFLDNKQLSKAVLQRGLYYKMVHRPDYNKDSGGNEDELARRCADVSSQEARKAG
jgi:hypothetical protein